MRGREGHPSKPSSALSLGHRGTTLRRSGGAPATGWGASPLSRLPKAEVRGSAGLDHVEITQCITDPSGSAGPRGRGSVMDGHGSSPSVGGWAVSEPPAEAPWLLAAGLPHSPQRPLQGPTWNHAFRLLCRVGVKGGGVQGPRPGLAISTSPGNQHVTWQSAFQS